MNQKILKLTLLTLSLFLLSAIHAAVPHLINYQGRLSDAGGIPLDGAHTITFYIYDAENAGTLLWQEEHTDTLIQKGVFSIMLGSVTNLNIPFDKPYFLEIKVGSEIMTPRQRITSVGYALRAEEAEAVSGITNFFPASGNVGIGTKNPVEKLDITGAVAINSKRVIDGSGNWVGNPTNLIGPQGPPGPTGHQGYQGPPGPAIHTSASCGSACGLCQDSGRAQLECSFTCNGASKVVVSQCGHCSVTADTGSCNTTSTLRVCCVCKP